MANGVTGQFWEGKKCREYVESIKIEHKKVKLKKIESKKATAKLP